MSELSKSAMPSLVNIAFMTIIKTCIFMLLFPAFKRNVSFFKQANCSISFGPLKKTVSQICTGCNLVAPSDQKEARSLILFGASNLQLTQMFPAYNGFEICIIISLARIGVLVKIFILKRLQNHYAQSEKKKELFEMVSFTLEDPILKRIESFLVKPRIFSPFFQQIPHETKKVLNDSKEAHKSTEMAIIPKALDSNQKMCNLEEVFEMHWMKTAKICFACEERIETKKFFDERRFGILERCNCMLCYGCIRKASGISDGVVKEPVYCPSCSVKSDIVASSRLWIEGEEKVKFLETFKKNLQSANKMENLKWTRLPIVKDDIWIGEPTTVAFLESIRKNLRSLNEKSEFDWTSLHSSKDDIWTRRSAMVSVN